MSAVPLRTDSDRYVVLLEDAATEYRPIDGSTRDSLDALFETFLTEPAPESALEDEQKLPNPLRQLKHRGSNVRGFAVWIRGTGFDLLVVQTLFDKRDERAFYRQIDQFASSGRETVRRFEEYTAADVSQKVEEWRESERFVLLENASG